MQKNGAIPFQRLLGVSKRSIYNLCASGAFKSVRIGTKLRISRKSFDEWLDGSD